MIKYALHKNKTALYNSRKATFC